MGNKTSIKKYGTHLGSGTVVEMQQKGSPSPQPSPLAQVYYHHQVHVSLHQQGGKDHKQNHSFYPVQARLCTTDLQFFKMSPPVCASFAFFCIFESWLLLCTPMLVISVPNALLLDTVFPGGGTATVTAFSAFGLAALPNHRNAGFLESPWCIWNP